MAAVNMALFLVALRLMAVRLVGSAAYAVPLGLSMLLLWLAPYMLERLPQSGPAAADRGLPLLVALPLSMIALAASSPVTPIRPWRFALEVAVVAFVFLVHPLTGSFLALALAASALTEPTLPVAARLTHVAAPAAGLALSLAWPFFPVLGAIAAAPSYAEHAFAGNWRQFYYWSPVRLLPASLGLLYFAAAWRKRSADWLSWALLACAALYLVNGVAPRSAFRGGTSSTWRYSSNGVLRWLREARDVSPARHAGAVACSSPWLPAPAPTKSTRRLHGSVSRGATCDTLPRVIAAIARSCAGSSATRHSSRARTWSWQTCRSHGFCRLCWDAGWSGSCTAIRSCATMPRRLAVQRFFDPAVDAAERDRILARYLVSRVVVQCSAASRLSGLDDRAALEFRGTAIVAEVRVVEANPPSRGATARCVPLPSGASGSPRRCWPSFRHRDRVAQGGRCSARRSAGSVRRASGNGSISTAGRIIPFERFLGGESYDRQRFLWLYPVNDGFPPYPPFHALLHLPFGLFPPPRQGLYAIATIGLMLLFSHGWRSRPRARDRGGGRLHVGRGAAADSAGALEPSARPASRPARRRSYLALFHARRAPWLSAVGLTLAMLKPTWGMPLAILMLVRGDRAAVAAGVFVTLAVNVPLLALIVHRAGGVGVFVDRLTSGYRQWQSVSDVSPATSSVRIDAATSLSRFLGHPLGDLSQVALTLLVIAAAAVAVRLLRTRSSPRRQGAHDRRHLHGGAPLRSPRGVRLPPADSPRSCGALPRSPYRQPAVGPVAVPRPLHDSRPQLGIDRVGARGLGAETCGVAIHRFAQWRRPFRTVLRLFVARRSMAPERGKDARRGPGAVAWVTWQPKDPLVACGSTSPRRLSRGGFA